MTTLNVKLIVAVIALIALCVFVVHLLGAPLASALFWLWLVCSILAAIIAVFMIRDS